MKIFLCIGLIFSFSSFAYNDGEKCLEEALESSIALKIYKLAAGNCSNLNRDKYRELEQTRQNKRRFFNEAVKGLNSGNKISSTLFLDLDDPAKEKQVDKNNICKLTQIPFFKAAKEIMKDCPEKDAPEMFQVMISYLKDPDKISDNSLAHVCQKVMKLKKQACHESKIVFHAFSGSNSGAKGKRE
jgi:hypothetical protein